MPADDKTSRTISSGSASSGPAGKGAGANPERDKALGLVLNQIERNFGKGSIMRLGDASRMRIETSPTGALTLDLALGGGYPKGRVVEIYGPESSGKTTLTLHAIAEVQRRGGVAAFVDAEQGNRRNRIHPARPHREKCHPRGQPFHPALSTSVR